MTLRRPLNSLLRNSSSVSNPYSLLVVQAREYGSLVSFFASRTNYPQQRFLLLEEISRELDQPLESVDSVWMQAVMGSQNGLMYIAMRYGQGKFIESESDCLKLAEQFLESSTMIDSFMSVSKYKVAGPPDTIEQIIQPPQLPRSSPI